MIYIEIKTHSSAIHTMCHTRLRIYFGDEINEKRYEMDVMMMVMMMMMVMLMMVMVMLMMMLMMVMMMMVMMMLMCVVYH